MLIKIWVGKRESDILTYEYFDVSITFWGSNINHNHSFCTDSRIKDNYKNEFTDFVVSKLLQYLPNCDDDGLAIHFYNNIFAYKIIQIAPKLKKYIVNINKQHIIDILRHKTLSRLWLQNTISVPDFCYLSKSECEYMQLLKFFPKYKKFVIQKNFSGGGNGTYLMTKENCNIIIEQLDESDIFLVSPYYENAISLSCHVIIDAEKVIVFPISEQLLNYDNYKISFCGNKYFNNQSSISIATKEAADTIGKRLFSIGYRGICGFDFIFSTDKILLIEINPRYQGSSYIINAALKKENLPSLFEMNSNAFSSSINEYILKKIDNLNIPYESHTCYYNDNTLAPVVCSPKSANLFLDGLAEAKNYEKGVYLYRYIVNETL